MLEPHDLDASIVDELGVAAEKLEKADAKLDEVRRRAAELLDCRRRELKRGEIDGVAAF